MKSTQTNKPFFLSLSQSFGQLLLALSLLLTVATTLPIQAQVRNAPAGNSLPDTTPNLGSDPLHLGHDPHAGHNHGPMTFQHHKAFSEQVDLTRFRMLSIFDQGKPKIIDTVARQHLNSIYGKPRYKDVINDATYDPVFTYLDLIFHKTYYANLPIIQVEVLPVRDQLLAALDMPVAEREQWRKWGRLTPIMFSDPRVQAVLQSQNGDLRKIEAKRDVLVAGFFFGGSEQEVNLISPPPGSDQWVNILRIPDNRLANASGELPAGMSQMLDSNASTEQIQAIARVWSQLSDAWIHGDAASVNTILHELSQMIPAVHPQSYPSDSRRYIERLYNYTGKFSIAWVLYALAAVALFIAFSTGRKTLIGLGIAALISGFALHTAAMLIRSALTGRWPIHNQFESFVAVAWMAVLVGVVIMFARKQWVFGASAAVLGCMTFMTTIMFDIPSNEAGRVAGILATSRILYVHVNTVLASYALIGLGFFVSLFYLGFWYLGGAGAKIKASQQVAEKSGNSPNMGDVAARDDGYADPDPNLMQFAAAGVVSDPAVAASMGPRRLLGDLDKAQMIVLQLAFWILGVGTLLGAYWADHAWGRWWAWDPKETWALVTWIIYLIAIHMRFSGVKNRGLVTAWLSVIGFFVMLWCWWGVNMLLAGLHSYA